MFSCLHEYGNENGWGMVGAVMLYIVLKQIDCELTSPLAHCFPLSFASAFRRFVPASCRALLPGPPNAGSEIDHK